MPAAKGPGGAAVWGHVRATFKDSSGPVSVREAGIQLYVRTEVVNAKGKKEARRFTLLTDRRGWFYQDGLEPGDYRIEMLHTVDWSAAPPPRTPDMVFWLWNQAWEVGLGGIQLAADDGETAPGAAFALGMGEQRYLGHLELTVQAWPFDPEEGCARFEPAPASPETYNSLTAARLCVRQRADEARVWLDARRR